MRPFSKIAFAGAVLLLAGLAPMDQAEALSCYSPYGEVIELQLDSVTEDGASVTNTSAYDSFDVRLEITEGDPSIEFIALTNFTDSWRETYQ